MEETINEKRYTNGFNDGYLLSRYDPELIKKITKISVADNPYFAGMAEGNKAHERELFLNHLDKSRMMQQTHKPKLK